MRAQLIIKAAVFAVLTAFPLLSPAATLSPGDILVAAYGSVGTALGSGGIFQVDPTTGVRTVITGYGVGSGPDLDDPVAVVVTPAGDLLVSDLSAGSIYCVDPNTGDRTLVSGPGVGNGPAFGGPLGLALGPDNTLIVTTEWTHSIPGLSIGDVYRVDLATGDRSVLSSGFLGIGTGPDVFQPAGIVFDENGQILVTDYGRVLVIDPLTGNRNLLSGDGVATGPEFSSTYGIAIEESGELLVADYALGAVLRVDPMTGHRELASGAGVGSGPTLQGLFGVTVSLDGTILATDIAINALYSIDPITGDRTPLSGNGVGQGIDFSTPAFITVVPVPEPSTVILFITGLLFVITSRWARVVRQRN